VGVCCRAAKAEDAECAGVEFVGADDLAEQIKVGSIEFDRCIGSPDRMAIVGQLGKILGPKGLMPNPKLGTVTPDVAKAVKDAKGGAIEFRAEKAGIVHAGVGKASFSEEDIVQNIRSFFAALVKAKPSGVKGTYIKRIAVTSTMGPGIKIDMNSALEDKKAA